MTKGHISELLANRHSGGRSQDSSTECGQGWNLYLGCYIICACHWTQMFYHWDLGEERIVPASHLRGHSHSWWGRQACSVAIEVSLSYHLCTQETKRKMGLWQGGACYPKDSRTPVAHLFRWVSAFQRFYKVLKPPQNSATYWKTSLPTHEPMGTFHIHGGPSLRPSAVSSLG